MQVRLWRVYCAVALELLRFVSDVSVQRLGA